MKRKHWSLLVISVVLLAAMVLTSCSSESSSTTQAPENTQAAASTSQAPAATTAQGPAKVLKLSYSMPKGSSIATGYEWFAEEFPQRSNGRYKVETYPSSSLIGVPVAFDSVKKGVAEIVMTSCGANPSSLPLSLVAELPTLGFMGDSVDSWKKAYQAAWELYDNVPEIAAEYKDVHVLAIYPVDPFNLVTRKKEVRQASDFNGMKIGGSGHSMEIVTANGGAKIQQVPPESYLNLDKGVTDGALITFSQIMAYKIAEICDYFYTQNFGSGQLLVLMNKAAWDGMSEEDQQLITEVWTESTIVSAEGSIAALAAGRKYVEDQGKTITPPTPEETAAWNEAAQVSFTKWKSDCVAQGVSADVADKVLNEWKALVTKYRDQ
ncbi:MAG: TRAP transporter substrate-binding protein DctP [Dehalococcoidales bacterium]|nr:TRAP transporter substrate-binding protein DctP [Dehalococcoidales bacterium]